MVEISDGNQELKFQKYDAEKQSLLLEIEELKSKLSVYQFGWEPGHFYSPIPSIEEIKQKEDRLFEETPKEILDVNLNNSVQLSLFSELQPLFSESPFIQEESRDNQLRYKANNSNYSHGEALILYSMIRLLKPQKIVEIGSGYSSCAILDVNDLFFSGSIDCTFIEPYPDLLKSLLRPSDIEGIDIVSSHAQSIDERVFEKLTSGDILFIDSTHVSKIDSDVNHIFFRILPCLNSGVYIHFHDIYYPFEYPKHWIYEGRAWNEAYMLRAFLQNNDKYEIVLFNSYLNNIYFNQHESRDIESLLKELGSSIWLRKK